MLHSCVELSVASFSISVIYGFFPTFPVLRIDLLHLCVGLSQDFYLLVPSDNIFVYCFINFFGLAL